MLNKISLLASPQEVCIVGQLAPHFDENMWLLDEQVLKTSAVV